MAFSPPSPGSGDDLTTRARIRNVALTEFAERGFKATTIRGVARRAGVSPSSVQHHFGTKEGLRDACDVYVAEQLRRGVAEGVTSQSPGDPDTFAATSDAAAPILRYLARALTEGSPTAAALFDEVVVLTESYLANLHETEFQSWGAPVRDQAAVYAAMKLGVVVLHGQLSRALDIDPFGPDGMTRVQHAILDIVAQHLKP